jgi:MYXO-CTERM domain-containing protein
VKRRWTSLVLAGWLGLLSAPAHAAVDDPSFVETKLGMLRYTSSIAWAPDGSERLFLTTKLGEIRILEHGVLTLEPFATLAPIFTGSECGLLGIAFDPDFLDNGYVYVFVTVSETEQQIIRYTARGNTGVDKTPIVVGLPTKARNHNGGALGFGPDGKLYWAIGDNGLSPRAGVDGDLLSLGAKVGRANPDGSAPSDNPFFDGEGPNNDYIWARGFRNPFTMTFQPATGRLWLDVVGSHTEQVFTPQRGDNGGWDNYEGNQPNGFLTPVISYDTDTAIARDIAAAGAVRAGGVVTITTTAAHRLRAGAHVTIAGVTNASFNTTAFITSVTPTTFTFAQAGANASSGGGTATPDKIGGCVAGGTFWDSSTGPKGYEGSFFFGDYNGASIWRATLDPQNHISKVEHWASGVTRVIDMAQGPDGDLYYASYTGALFRASYTAPAQALVVSKLNLRLNEGGKAAFSVRLATAPASDIDVQVAAASGDGDVSVAEGAKLSFDAKTWTTPQRVLVAAAADVDRDDDHATLEVSASKLPTVTVKVDVTDLGSGGGGGGAGSGGESDASSGGAHAQGGEPSSPPAGSTAAGGDVALPDDGNGEAGLPDMAEGGDESAGAGPTASPTPPSDDSGCGCYVAGAEHPGGALVAVGLGLALALRRSRRRGR